jgi:hypothetical protein
VAEGPEPSPTTLEVVAAVSELYRRIPGIGMALIRQQCKPERLRHFIERLMHCAFLLTVYLVRLEGTTAQPADVEPKPEHNGHRPYPPPGS